MTQFSTPPGTDGPGLHVAARSEPPGQVVVSLAGELDYDSVPALATAVAPVLDRAVPERLVLDLTELTFIDSAGIKALLDCRALAEGRRCPLEVRSPRPLVLRVLEIAGVTTLLGLAPDDAG